MEIILENVEFTDMNRFDSTIRGMYSDVGGWGYSHETKTLMISVPDNTVPIPEQTMREALCQ